MAYTKPGVEISQVQKSTTPILIEPDLFACVIGKGYWWQDPTWDNSNDSMRHSVYATQYDGTEMVIQLSGINSRYYDIDNANSVVADLSVVTGDNAGDLIHLEQTTHFTVDTAANTVTILASLITGRAWVKLGYLANNTDAEGFKTFESVGDIKDTIGEPVSWNPLAFGSYLAMINSNTVINAFGVSGNNTPYADALDGLETKEVYALAPMAHTDVSTSAFATHCTSMSLAVNKKERVAFLNREITNWEGGAGHGQTSSEKTTTVQTIRDANALLGERRLFMSHPDVAFLRERRHISTIHPTWIQNSFSGITSINFTSYNVFARLIQDVTLSTNIKYKSGTNITSTIWTELTDDSWEDSLGMVEVLVPVPGFYFNAVNAGLRVGLSPEQPLTNVPTAGLNATYGSQDYFSETQLNILAIGGTWIMNQVSAAAAISSRHQLSTDTTSIAARECSVTTAVDFTAKFLRNAMSPFIGRHVIDTSFLKLTETIIFGAGRYLKREKIIRDLKILTVVQDSLNPDTILAEVEILVKYPVNYIKVTLQF